MCKRLAVIGLMLLGLIVISASDGQAQWNISITGLGPKGLRCDAEGLAGGRGDKSILCAADGVCDNLTAPDGTCTGNLSSIPGVLSCTNNGGNFALGRNPVEIVEGLEGLRPLDDKDVKNGKFRNQTVVALLSDPTREQLTPFCPQNGFGWTAFDFAPCNGPFEAFAELLVDDETRAQVRVVCGVPGEEYSCSQLSFAKKLGTFSGPDYTCRICPQINGNWDCKSCLDNPGSCQLMR